MIGKQDEGLFAMLIAGEQFFIHLGNLFGERIFLFALIDIGKSFDDLKASQYYLSIEYLLGDHSQYCQKRSLTHKAW